MRLALSITAIILCVSACGNNKAEVSSTKGLPETDAVIAARRSTFLQARSLRSSDISASKNWKCNRRAAFGTSNYEENYWLNLSLADEPGLAIIKKAKVGTTTWQDAPKAVIDTEFRQISQSRENNGCVLHWSYVYRMTAEGALIIEGGMQIVDPCTNDSAVAPSIVSPDTHFADNYAYCK